jgi:hypothetical protein
MVKHIIILHFWSSKYFYYEHIIIYQASPLLIFENSHILVCLFFFFDSTGVWTQGFMLAKQVLFCLRHTSSPTTPIVLHSAGLWSSYFRLHVSWHDRCVPKCLAFSVVTRSNELFKPGMSSNAILLISAFCVPGITDAHHHAQLLAEMGSYKLFALVGLELWSFQSLSPRS